MATNILMPALSPTMTEGTLARWLKQEGEAIAAGDVIAEIETDKATMEVEAVDEGVLGRILVPDGTAGVAVNAPIAILVEQGESVPDAAGDGAAPAAPRAGSQDSSAATPSAAGGNASAFPASATPAAGSNGATHPGASAGVPAGGYGAEGALAQGGQQPGASQSGAAQSASTRSGAAGPGGAPAANGHAGGERVFASPLARRMAREAGLDLSLLQGSGPNGRIVRADIDKAQAAGTGRAQPAAAPAASSQATQAAPARPPATGAAAPVGQAPQGAPPTAPGPTPVMRPAPVAITAPHQRLPNSNVRKTIARRLSESKQFTPHFYCSIDVELDALLGLRTQLNAKSPKEGAGAFKLSVNDLLIKACAATLRRVPKVNACYTDEAILQFDDVDISVAVSIPDGLITPIIKGADRKGLAAISNEAKDLIARARAGKLKPDEFQGGTFSISNMGMYGVREFSAIINPPQGAILAVAAGEQRPVVRDGQLAVATVMTVTLSVDHRVIDGALAAEWVAAFKAVVEDPLSLML